MAINITELNNRLWDAADHLPELLDPLAASSILSGVCHMYSASWFQLVPERGSRQPPAPQLVVGRSAEYRTLSRRGKRTLPLPWTDLAFFYPPPLRRGNSFVNYLRWPLASMALA